jgi:hypothetical protein
MPPTLSEFVLFERKCVMDACGSSPLDPSRLCHTHSDEARHRVFCAQYGNCTWPPHDGAHEDLARPAFCKLKVMAIAAESCPALQPAYASVYNAMLANVEVTTDHTATTVVEDVIPLFTLNTLISDMGLGHINCTSMHALHQAMRATYTIASCASAAYPVSRETQNTVTGIPVAIDTHYPMAFRAEATTAVHLFCYKQLRDGAAPVAPPQLRTAAAAAVVIPAHAAAVAPVAYGGYGGFGGHDAALSSSSSSSSVAGSGSGGFGTSIGGGDDEERLRFGDLMEEIAGVDDMDFDAQQELKMMAGMAMAQMDRKRKYTRPRDDLGGRIYTQTDRDAMESAITKCMRSKKAKI